MSFIIGILIFSTLTMMIEAAYVTHKYDFKGLFAHVFSPKYLWILHLIIFLLQIGSVMIYSNWCGILVNRTLGLKYKVLNSNIFWNFVCSLCLSFPLTIPKSIAKLEVVASVGFILIFLLICHSVYWFIKDLKAYGFDPNKQFVWMKWDTYIFIPSLGIITLAYNYIINLFPTLEHLKNCTIKRAYTLNGTVLVTCFILYAILGVCTYLDKFDVLQASSALELYPASNRFTIVATVCVVFILIISSPLFIWAARNSIDAIIFKDKEMTTLRWVLTGFILMLISAGLAATSSNIIIFFNIVGGLFIPVVALILPALFFLRVTPGRKWYRTVQAVISMVYAIAVIVSCTWQTVMKIKGK